MSHMWRLMSLAWFALALQWVRDGVWGQSAVTFTLGLVCYAAGERYQAVGR